MKNNELLDNFDFIYSSINYFDKSARIRGALEKHNLDPQKTYFIGDETRDMNAAKLSGTKTIAVTWGTESKILLNKANPTMIIQKPSNLLKIFK